MKNLITWLSMLSLAITVGCTDTSDSLLESESKQLSVEQLPIFDDSIPVAAGSYSEWLLEDIDEITEDADVIFLGRVVDYKERLFLHDLESSSWPRYWVYDGIVLQADELLLGEMPDPDSKITLAVRALTEHHDGTVHSRHVDREISIFGEGIRSIGSAESPQYLVYAGPSPPGTRWHELGLYWILSSGGAVRVYGDGSLGAGIASPFAEVWDANAEGEYDWVTLYDLQDARDAAELAKSGIEDTSGIPEEQSTGLDEEPVEEPDDGLEELDSDADTTQGTGSDDLDVGEDNNGEAGSDGSAELSDGSSGDLREDSPPDGQTPEVEGEIDSGDDVTEGSSDHADPSAPESLETGPSDSDDGSGDKSNDPGQEDAGDEIGDSSQPSDSDADTTQSSDSSEVGGEGSGDAGEDQSVDPVPDGSGGESAPQGESADVDSATPETGDRVPGQDDVSEESMPVTGDESEQAHGGLDVVSPGG